MREKMNKYFCFASNLTRLVLSLRNFNLLACVTCWLLIGGGIQVEVSGLLVSSFEKKLFCECDENKK